MRNKTTISRRLQYTLISSFSIFITSCASTGPSQEIIDGVKITYLNGAPIRDIKSKSAKIPSQYEVKKGDSIFLIAEKYELDYRDIAKNNDLGGNYVIFPGQVLNLKEGGQQTGQNEGKQATKKSDASNSKKTNNVKNQRVKSTTKNKSPAKASAPAASQGKGKEQSAAIIPADPPPLSKRGWMWPVKDKPDYEKVASKNGVYIYSASKADVRAVNNGRVVYVGNELEEYGKLVLISHQGGYLSVYAENSATLVKADQNVNRGENIAIGANSRGVGISRGKIYFEIRKEGKSIDPINLLLK